jgi:hypothetical protein
MNGLSIGLLTKVRMNATTAPGRGPTATTGRCVKGKTVEVEVVTHDSSLLCPERPA